MYIKRLELSSAPCVCKSRGIITSKGIITTTSSTSSSLLTPQAPPHISNGVPHISNDRNPSTGQGNKDSAIPAQDKLPSPPLNTPPQLFKVLVKHFETDAPSDEQLLRMRYCAYLRVCALTCSITKRQV